MAIAGKVAPTYDGDWSADKSYQQHTYVRYNGDAYIALKASVGIEPTNKEYWFLALKNVSQAQLDALNNRIDSIQTTSSGTLSQAGWYRVAEYNANATAVEGAASNSCELFIKRLYTNTNCENHHLLLMSRYQRGQKIVSLYDSSSDHLITKARYTIEGTAAYLEIYYNSDSDNFCYFEVTHGKDIDYCWQAITPVLTSETVDGVTITCTYDIPSNASPVTNLDLASYVTENALIQRPIYYTGNTIEEIESIYQSLFEKADGLSQALVAHSVTWQDLPTTTYYVETFRPFGSYGYQKISSYFFNAEFFRYCHNGTWGGWEQKATTADLAKYFPIDGSGAVKNTIQLKNSEDTNICALQTVGNVYGLYSDVLGKWLLSAYVDKTGTPIFDGVAAGNLPLDGSKAMTGGLNIVNGFGAFKADGNHAEVSAYNIGTSASNYRGLLIMNSNHSPDVKSALVLRDMVNSSYTDIAVLTKANSVAVAVTASAPSDTTALWYDTVNKMLKRYVDGAWQQ